MRIGLVIYGALDQQSGGYLYDRILVEGLRRHGHYVEVLSLPKRTYVGNVLNNLATSQMGAGEFDVLLQDELNHPSLFIRNRRNHGNTTIVTIVHHLRSSEPHSAALLPLYRRVEVAYLQTADGAIYNSHATRTTVEDLIGPGLPSVVAQPGRGHISVELKPGAIERRAKQEGPLQVVFLGNLVPRKGLHLLVEALHSLPKSEWRLTVVGSMEFDRTYSSEIELLSDLGGNVRLLGALSYAELGAYLQEAHVLAMPSSYEGFGIAYLDGMGFGLPAIATTAGGASDLVRDGKNGFLVPPDDVDALRDRLVRLASDRSLLAQMGKQALADFRQHPTWVETSDTIHTFLLELVGASEPLEAPLRTSAQSTEVQSTGARSTEGGTR